MRNAPRRRLARAKRNRSHDAGRGAVSCSLWAVGQRVDEHPGWHGLAQLGRLHRSWIPACAGMTGGSRTHDRAGWHGLAQPGRGGTRRTFIPPNSVPARHGVRWLATALAAVRVAAAALALPAQRQRRPWHAAGRLAPWPANLRRHPRIRTNVCCCSTYYLQVGRRETVQAPPQPRLLRDGY